MTASSAMHSVMTLRAAKLPQPIAFAAGAPTRRAIPNPIRPAKRLHRSQGWVSQRLSLLTLTPELQARIGQEPIDLLRAVGKKPAEQQQAALEELKERRAREEAEKAEQKRK
ncbi:hypothetical protein ACFRFU_47400 [Streptomyces sp. NPDC056704]|uniref:hypothetical protein n=1 Tax=Streptomyces sp. NPDC056704 TaxID=3345917 RepID=UPI003694C3A4